MINIKDSQIQVSVLDALQTLKGELASENIELLKDIKDGPANVMITCPFHSNGQEHRPSMGVKKQGGIAHCFTCGEVVSFSELVSYCRNGVKSEQYGTTWLINRYRDLTFENLKAQLQFNEFRGKEKDKLMIAKSRGEKLNVDINTGKKIEKNFVSEEELDEYRWTHKYWAERGIVDEKIIELFDLGYDRKTKCITFPVRDKQGNCEFVARRSVNTKFFQYPPGVSKPLYGLYELYSLYNKAFFTGRNKLTSIMLCESMIDGILLWQAKHPALAFNGLGNERQFRQLRELPFRHFILVTDNDEAGKKARARIRKYVPNKLFSDIIFPEGIKDVGDLGKQHRYKEIEDILDWEHWNWERN